ncbi:MAG: CopG family transcriptional regulator [Candidatus Micrarchaeia archaeon]
MDSKSRKYTTITIPKPLYDKLAKVIGKTGFSSVSDYVTFIMREILTEMEAKSDDKEKSEVIRKLHALGYL